ncbi:hypothetical protein CRUP_001934 [Coryphaenoides rupestris]|nr:hypothetical protein CRUP_001934 [Coryphaenoides rupestris]
MCRKICRNCKCGLAEHNVHMESEESKKVGKLFEDTKYTGLIAKLKTDGIPSYKGNAVTISLPAPASSYLVPPASVATAVPPPSAAGSAPSSASTSVPFSGARGPGRAPSDLPPASAAPPPVFASSVAPAKVNITPVMVNTVPVAVSAASAAVKPLSKDVPMKSVTYEWAPPVANKYMAVRYIELLPPEKRPVAGSEGAAYRRQQMACQLPEHDQDPSKCHELSPAEVKQMEQYVRKYKDDALGMGDVRLPEEMALVRAAAGQGGPGGPGAAGGGRGGVGAAGSGPGATSARAGVGAGYGPGVPGAPAGASSAHGSSTGGTGAPWPGSEAGLGPGEPGSGQGGTLTAAGALGVPGPEAAGAQQSFSCSHCQQPMRRGEPAVYAERAGYDRLWHPACFVCCTCSELLVDMIYFWKKGKLYCGRHYGDKMCGVPAAGGA